MIGVETNKKLKEYEDLYYKREALVKEVEYFHVTDERLEEIKKQAAEIVNKMHSLQAEIASTNPNN